MSIFSKLGDKSWMTPGVVGEVRDRSRGDGPAAKTGLAFFMAVLTSMFFLFVVGYRMRMMQNDWVPVNDPGLLWVNTGLLVLASVAMQAAKRSVLDGKIRAVRIRLTIAGALSAGFLIGQLLAWTELRATGLYALQSPATAFFMLLTGLHALHLFGGMLVWCRATYRAWRGMEVKRIRLSVELCTTYWHYMLLVWLVFFTVLLMT
ncbi:MAG: cytochrome oxidase subunit III [Gammaproteobacteria bacterium]|nr:cytochrome oxidase subunit III [Gammaproteobacteria bacterium]